MEYIAAGIFSLFVYDNETNNNINKNEEANPLFWGLHPYCKENKYNHNSTTTQNKTMMSDDSSISKGSISDFSEKRREYLGSLEGSNILNTQKSDMIGGYPTRDNGFSKKSPDIMFDEFPKNYGKLDNTINAILNN